VGEKEGKSLWKSGRDLVKTTGRGLASNGSGGGAGLNVNPSFKRRFIMVDVSEDKGFDEIPRNLGRDTTAMFDGSPSNPTEHASSEVTIAATAVDDDDVALEDEDDVAAEEEEWDEEDEEEDVEDEAGA
jgi:hypothetical protein